MITLVTGNPRKVEDFLQIMPDVQVQHVHLDLPEIQSFVLEEITKDKALSAQRKIGGAVLVDDVALDLEVLGGFPGPFVKFWHKEVGYDLVTDLVEKTGKDKAVLRSGFGYADAERFLYVERSLVGRFVRARGSEGIGFDFHFVPEGETQTYAEMGSKRRNLLSERRLGLEAMRERLKQEGII